MQQNREYFYYNENLDKLYKVKTSAIELSTSKPRAKEFQLIAEIEIYYQENPIDTKTERLTKDRTIFKKHLANNNDENAFGRLEYEVRHFMMTTNEISKYVFEVMIDYFK